MSKKSETLESAPARKVAIQILLAVLKEGQSLSSLERLTENLEHRERAFARLLSFGVLRFYQQLQGLLRPLMKKPLKAKDLDVQLTLLMGLYQIMHSRVPDYAVVDAAVKQVRKSRKQWAANMVNAVLRSFIRQQQTLLDGLDNENEETQFAHPQWIIDRLKQDWPESWQTILTANLAQAPLVLRINQQRTTPDDYLLALKDEAGVSGEKLAGVPFALVLDEARDVRQLPGFEQGWFSVQDAGAQLAAQILQPCAGECILDACAAPGGKTAHLYEIQADIQLTALDISESRLQRVAQNAQRLGFSPRMVVGDATDVESWWQGEMFDKILLDVPCSATGVIRRHPDIKQLRTEEDIQVLVELQRDILRKNWTLLKPAGRLLYATCSLFKAENQQQIEWFLKNTPDAQLIDISAYVQLKADTQDLTQADLGLQLFPASHNNDGFYYALLEKHPD